MTMFSDGTASFFLIQHKDRDDDRWTGSALGHFLFEGLSYSDSRDAIGDRYRALIAPQGANSDLWQRFGVHGYVERSDAEAVLRALRERHPERAFRMAHRTITQTTTVVHPLDETIGGAA